MDNTGLPPPPGFLGAPIFFKSKISFSTRVCRCQQRIPGILPCFGQGGRLAKPPGWVHWAGQCFPVSRPRQQSRAKLVNAACCAFCYLWGYCDELEFDTSGGGVPPTPRPGPCRPDHLTVERVHQLLPGVERVDLCQRTASRLKNIGFIVFQDCGRRLAAVAVPCATGLCRG